MMWRILQSRRDVNTVVLFILPQVIYDETCYAFISKGDLYHGN